MRLATQFENAGDCLINRELIRLLAERGDVHLDTGRCPADFARQVASNALSGGAGGGRPFFYLRMLLARSGGRRCFWFLMPGAVSGGARASGRLACWLRDLPLLCASMLGVRICQIGVSFDGMTEEHLSVWLRRRRYLWLLNPRDSASAGYLERHGVRCDRHFPDLAFNLFGAADLPTEREVERAHAAALSLRTDQYPEQAADVTRAAQAVCRAAGGDVCWIPVVQVCRDLGGMEAVLATLRAEGVQLAPVSDRHRDVEACLRCYRGVSLVVSNRLHVLLMAASQGARIVAVAGGAGGAKIEGVFRDLGMGEAVVSPRLVERIGPARLAGFAVEGRAQRDLLRQAFDALFSAAPVPGTRNRKAGH